MPVAPTARVPTDGQVCSAEAQRDPVATSERQRSSTLRTSVTVCRAVGVLYRTIMCQVEMGLKGTRCDFPRHIGAASSSRKRVAL